MSAFESFPRITPFLWFDANAEEAVNFYVSVFPNSRVLETLRRKIDDPSGKQGSVLTIAFELDGQKLTALNGGPGYPFTQAISLVVRCDSQAEVDEYWSRLTAGGTEIQCGWLKDKFGMHWQITPARLIELIKNPRAFAAMMQMVKIDIAAIERAAAS